MARQFIMTVAIIAWFGMLYGTFRALRTYPDVKALSEEVRRTFAPSAAVCITCLWLLTLMGHRSI